MKTNNTIYTKAKTWQVLSYPVANAVQNMFYVLMMFASYLAAGSYGIAVAVAGTIITFTRVFDGITDPIIGLVSDKLNSRFGKVRMLLLIGWSIMALSVGALFFWGVGKGVVFFTLMYMVYIIGYTFFNVGYHPGNAILTNDPKQRPKLFRWSTIYTTLLSTFVSVYMSNFLFPKHRGLNLPAFQEMATTVLIITFVLLLLACIAISERDKPEAFVNATSERIKFKDAISLLKKNKALQSFIVAATSDKLALQTAGQQAINVMIFGIIIGNYPFAGTLRTINLIPTLAFILLATRIAGSKGSKKAVIQWTWISVLVATTMVVFMIVIDPTQVSKSPVITTIFIGLFAAFASVKMATSACTMAMIPDIIDYERYRSGNYMPAVVSTVYSFVDKLVSSLATTIIGFSVALIGYTEQMPQPLDASTTAVFWMGLFLWMGVPILGWLCTLVAMKFYPLDKDMMVTVQSEKS